MRRKVIKQGNGTLTMTLPKQWTEKVGLKGGDEIDIDVQGSVIRVNTTKEKAMEEKTVNIEGIESSAARILSSLYKQGYDNVKIFFSEAAAVKKIQDEVRNHLMTYEVVDQTEKSLTIKSLSTEHFQDFDAILRKAFQVGLSLAKNSLDHIKAGEFDKLEDLLVLEKANNRFTSFCHRIIAKKGYSKPGKDIFIYTLIWQLEKVVDNYKYLVQYLAQTKKKPDKELIKLYNEVNDFFDLFYQIFYKYDAKKLDNFSKIRKSLINKCNELLNNKKYDHRIIYYFLNIISDVFDLTGPYYSLRS
ncbi:phosphate uptake regulator PhoU [Candidatus Woesearchaeota archaeon]|nr:phosphate uptake regulator PhoU [Candidatus Woesearchaeota archaeon]